MNWLKKWFYKNFAKLDSPANLDWFLISIVAFLIVCFMIAIKVFIYDGGII